MPYRSVPVAAAEVTDTALLTRVAAGDSRALEALYAAHGPAVMAYLMRLIGDHTIAEEALQDTILVVWRTADRFQGRSTLRTWLLGIARRQALSRVRGRRPDLLPLADVAEIADAKPGPEDGVLQRATQDEVRRAVRGLTPIHREVLTLAFVDELAYREIADVLQVPVGTVKSRMWHAKAALRVRLLRPEEGRT